MNKEGTGRLRGTFWADSLRGVGGDVSVASGALKERDGRHAYKISGLGLRDAQKVEPERS